MADSDVLITAGIGTKIDTRTVGPSVDEHRQVIVVGDPTTNTSVATVTANGQLQVIGRDLQRSSATIGGISTSGLAYVAGNQIGTLTTITNAARATGGSGVLTGMVIADAGVALSAVDIYLFDQSITPTSTDKTALNIATSDIAKLVQVVQLTGPFTTTSSRHVQAQNISVPYTCSGGTSLYALLVARAANAIFGASETLTLICYFERF